MQTAATTTTIAGTTATGAHRPAAATPATRRRPAPTLPYGWPLTALFAGLGLWWALGLGELAVLVFATFMAGQLIWRRAPIIVPQGFGIWLLFLLWSLLTIVTLGLNPAGYLSDSLISRLLPFGYRLAAYGAVTIIVLYVLSLDRTRYSLRKLSRVLGVAFLWVVAGGYLGILAPTFAFTSPVEMVMPGSVRSNVFVQSFVHPQAAQLQDFLGYVTSRPAAPFGFTNVWGHSFAVLLPWFVVGFIVYARGWRRLLGYLVLVAGIVPATMSLNRGLWIGLALLIAYVAVRQLLRGKLLAAAGALTATLLGVLVLAATPLGGLASERLETGHSDDAREHAASAAFELATTSPILGYGSTRTAYGSANSIGVGRSAECPQCGSVPTGTHGQLWFELVAHGFVGAALYVGILGYVVWRYRRDTSPVGLVAHASVLLMLWFMFIYSALAFPLAVAFVSWAALRRNEEEQLAARLAGST